MATDHTPGDLAEPRTITVLAHRAYEAVEVLTKLARKAERYGSPIRFDRDPPHTVVHTVEGALGERVKVRVDYVDITVSGASVRIGEHEFLAKITPADGGNYVDVVPGVAEGTLDEKFRTAATACEHCQVRRQRKEVFVVRGTDGHQLMVGRQCLKEYMGVDPAQAIAHMEFLARLGNTESEFYGRPSFDQTTIGILTFAQAAARTYGWVSHKMAGEHEGMRSTSSRVALTWTSEHRQLDKYEAAEVAELKAAVTEQDHATAATVLAWVRDTMTGDGEYVHNLKLAVRGDVVTEAKRVGLVVSAVQAYARAIEVDLRRKSERELNAGSVHLGAIGGRLRKLAAVLTDQRVIGSGPYGDRVLIKARTEDGSLLTWFTSGGTGLEIGAKVYVTGTVKDHKEYQGVKETVITRGVIDPRA